MKQIVEFMVEDDTVEVKLMFVDAVAAGTCFGIFEVIKFGDKDELIGKKICVELEETIGMYFAEHIWSDGFVANWSTDESVEPPPYRKGDDDNEGTAMGGEIVPELNGLIIPFGYENILFNGSIVFDFSLKPDGHTLIDCTGMTESIKINGVQPEDIAGGLVILNPALSDLYSEIEGHIGVSVDDTSDDWTIEINIKDDDAKIEVYAKTR